MYIFNDSWLMLMNWCSMINRPVDDQSRWNRDRFEHSRDLQWPSTLRAPASSTLTTVFHPTSIASLQGDRWLNLKVGTDMSCGWNINQAGNHAYLTHIRLNGKIHGRYTKNNRKRAARRVQTNSALISSEVRQLNCTWSFSKVGTLEFFKRGCTHDMVFSIECTCVHWSLEGRVGNNRGVQRLKRYFPGSCLRSEGKVFWNLHYMSKYNKMHSVWWQSMVKWM